jgi:aspartyl-tRNA(Asn)/glutamyl-tRNA(Gln) amidotransferase subunit B
VALALRIALALECAVHRRSLWARKNYFYPDLPKGYQITQYDAPLATAGVLELDGADGPSQVRIRRVHLEEDAGKSLHERFPGATAVDFNRAGTPLVEIVTEPDLATPSDARAFLQRLKLLLEYLDVSDCSMEEGSLRVDANVSIRPTGSAALEAKTEIKNVNSFAHIEKALTREVERQIAIRQGDGSVRPLTLLWDDHRGELRVMRFKEEDRDYRYFPEPDLPALVLSTQELARARGEVPELPRARRDRFVRQFGLPFSAAEVLTRTRGWGDYFEAVAVAADPKEACNWVNGPVTALAGEAGAGEAWRQVPPRALAELLGLVAEGTLSHAAGRRVLAIVADTGRAPREVVRSEGLAQVSDPETLEAWVGEVMTEHQAEVERYREGESKVLGFLMGRVMRRSRGRADPREARRILQEMLEGE